MATHARQQYFADENSLSKEKREFSIADEIQEKIDSVEEGAQVNKIETVKVNGTALVPDANKAVNVEVPEVIDNLYTVDSDNALSAKQGKLLYDYIQNIASRGRFLSNWNSATGLPTTNPSESPYLYKSGDYFVVSNVAGLGGTNYRPDGSSYIIGQASTVVEAEDVSVSDFYFYDGTNWLLLSNSGRQIAIDTSLSTTSTNPVENRVITNTLNGKQETLIAGNNIQIAADGKTISATDTTYSAGANISIDANNEISAVDTTYTAGTNVQISNQNVISATDTKYTAGTGINIDANNVISNTQTSAEWGNITGTLSDQTDLQNTLNEKQDKLAAGDNITIQDVCSTESDMRGPCPSGWHIGTQAEYVNICNIGSNIGAWVYKTSGTDVNLPTYLKWPASGVRLCTDGNISSQGSWYYRTSENLNVTNAYAGGPRYTKTWEWGTIGCGYGCPIRPLRNVGLAPDSSWVMIYDGSSTASGAGIFWSAAEGAISISADGTTWYTMADKNLGATTVYNYGDTRTEANCGGYFQWGNNHMFPGIGNSETITTSSDKVDVTGYGPGNYYDSNTFIVGGEGWIVSNNSNLRGGTTKWTFQDCKLTISATDTTYTAGTGINIDANNEISNTLPGPTIASTAPSNPTEGQLWYDTTNDVLKAYNGTSWAEVGNESADINTKTFHITSTGGDPQTIAEAEEIYDWYLAGKNPIVRYSNMTFVLHSDDANATIFHPIIEFSTSNSVTTMEDGELVFVKDNGSILVVVYDMASKSYLDTYVDYQTPYTPLYNGSPATKKYVDDSITATKSTGATAPSNPIEGQLWYDTTNDVLKVYDGTNWNTVNTDTTYTAGTGINIDQNNEISNTLPGPTIAATAPTGTEGALWYDTTNDVLMAYDGTAWKEAGTQMKVLSYGHSTWQEFLDAYNNNAIVYCKASSNSNPGSGVQGRMAFMAFVEINSSTQAIQSVEFQYYRSRSSHSTAATVLDEVYIYKLASNGTWTVTQRDTAAKPIAGTGIGLTYNASGMTISADTSVLATQTDLNSKADVADLNVKFFELASPSDLTTAQDIYDWFNAGNYPIVKNGRNIYVDGHIDINTGNFKMNLYHWVKDYNMSSSYLYYQELTFVLSSDTVTSVTSSPVETGVEYLDVNENYPTPYTPQYDGSPATKKYVDDGISGITFPVTSVNGSTGAVTVSEFTPGGTATTGYVVTKTAGGYEWSAPSGGDVMVSSQPNNILTSGMKIWAGTEGDYANLSSYDNNTVYLTVEGGATQSSDQGLGNDSGGNR